jgi:hypothetical protein
MHYGPARNEPKPPRWLNTIAEHFVSDADAQVAELGLLEIGVDPDITQPADHHQALTNLDVAVGIHAGDNAVIVAVDDPVSLTFLLR